MALIPKSRVHKSNIVATLQVQVCSTQPQTCHRVVENYMYKRLLEERCSCLLRCSSQSQLLSYYCRGLMKYQHYGTVFRIYGHRSYTSNVFQNVVGDCLGFQIGSIGLRHLEQIEHLPRLQTCLTLSGVGAFLATRFRIRSLSVPRQGLFTSTEKLCRIT